MSDRRAHPYPTSANVALASQWSAAGQYPSAYATSQDHHHHYSSTAYQAHHPSLRATSHSPQSVPAFDGMSVQAQAIAANYQLGGNDGQMHYTHIPTSDRRSSMSMAQYGAYADDSHYHSSPSPVVAPRAHAHSHSHSHSHSYSHPSSHALSPHSYAQSQAMGGDPYGAPLSSSPQASALAGMATASGGYVSQAAYAQQQQQQQQSQHQQQQVNASQYPASPPRPFACDMCALSFNRQHDLKRHRDTHTGEKPFLCNGGCGKTFTRKDALKRHQLVKRCGIDENSP